MPIHKSLEIWSTQTLCDLGIIFSITSFILYLSRPYFERILNRLTLRVAADLWWLIYIVIRDGLLLISFLFGFLTLNLDLMADIKIGLPFVPIATIFSALALNSKLYKNAEDINKSYRTTAVLVTLAAFFNTIGYVFVMEAPGREYNAAKTTFWQLMKSWRSNTNPNLSEITFYLSFSAIAAIAIIAIIKAFSLLSASINTTKKNV